MKIWIVDAFTSQPYHGNPAAVVLVQEFLKSEICQQIAFEMNLSETAFAKSLSKNHYHLRWFTPKVEVKLCGHATLACAHILHQEELIEGGQILFDSLSGPLKVYRQASGLTLDFPLQRTGPTLTGSALEVPSALFPKALQIVKAFDDLIVEVAQESLVKDYHPDFTEIAKIDCRGLILTARAGAPYDFVSRFFAPRVGVNEDPVTGSAHCKLAHYWQDLLGKSTFFAYQASPRGGEIHLSVVGERVHLTGQAVTILEGEWKVRV
jgi:PhzF family phenazine biosynthesis protein